MHRIEGTGVDADLFGAGKDGFTEGDPAVGVPSTEVSGNWLNAVQEEIANAVTLLGAALLTAATDTRKQLYRAIKWSSLKPMIAHLLSEFEACDVGSSGVQMTSVASHTRTDGVNEGTVVVVAAGLDGIVCASEDGGDNWFDSPFTPTDVIRKIVTGGDRFWLISDNSYVGHCQYANTSIGFTSIATGLGADLKGGCYSVGDDWLVVVGTGGIIGTGKLGAYTARTSGTTQELKAAAIRENAGAKVVCAGGGTTITRSSNGGATWAVVFTGGTNINDIVYDYTEAAWLACDEVGALVSVDDGLTWSRYVTNSLLNYGVWSACGVLVLFASSATAGYGCRLYFYEGASQAAIAWRSLADQNQTRHPLYFDETQGQFWLITGANDAVHRSKKAPAFLLRAIFNGLG